MKKRQLVICIAVIIPWIFLCASAEAVPIAFRFSGTGVYGTLNNVEFNNAKFLISIAGESTNVVGDGCGWSISGLTGGMSLSGGDLAASTSGTFLDPLFVFVDNGSRMVGFGSEVAQSDLIDLYSPNAGLNTYHLQYAFGPVTAGIGYPCTTLVNLFDTTLSFGALVLDQVDNGAFEALGLDSPAPPVPEPATMILFGSSLLFGLYGFRKKLNGNAR